MRALPAMSALEYLRVLIVHDCLVTGALRERIPRSIVHITIAGCNALIRIESYGGGRRAGLDTRASAHGRYAPAPSRDGGVRRGPVCAHPTLYVYGADRRPLFSGGRYRTASPPRTMATDMARALASASASAPSAAASDEADAIETALRALGPDAAPWTPRARALAQAIGAALLHLDLDDEPSMARMARLAQTLLAQLKARKGKAVPLALRDAIQSTANLADSLLELRWLVTGRVVPDDDVAGRAISLRMRWERLCRLAPDAATEHATMAVHSLVSSATEAVEALVARRSADPRMAMMMRRALARWGTPSGASTAA